MSALRPEFRPKVLLFGEADRPEWQPLRAVADVSTVMVPRELGRWSTPEPGPDVDVAAALEFAAACAGTSDFVLAERASAFLWHCLFRLAGTRTPFVIVPRFNCVHARDAYALFLSSQFADNGDVLFCGSQAAASAFAMYGFACSPTFLPGINLEVFRPLPAGRQATREALGVRGDRELLLYVGRMTDDKHVLELLDAVRLVRDARDVELVLCYHFERGGYLRRCREAAESVGGARFVHEPDTRTLVRWYNAADLYVSAAVSVFETFGRAPVEAMACGTPPVVPAYDGFRDTVTRKTGSLVPTTSKGLRKWPDVRLLADAVVAALEDTQGRESRARAGIARATQFGVGPSIDMMMAELERREGAVTCASTRHAQVSVAGYPEPIAEVWAPLDGLCLRDLVTEFVRSGRIPIRPTDQAVSRLYESWFAHY